MKRDTLLLCLILILGFAGLALQQAAHQQALPGQLMRAHFDIAREEARLRAESSAREEAATRAAEYVRWHAEQRAR